MQVWFKCQFSKSQKTIKLLALHSDTNVDTWRELARPSAVHSRIPHIEVLEADTRCAGNTATCIAITCEPVRVARGYHSSMSGVTFLSLLVIAQVASGRTLYAPQSDVNDTTNVPRSSLQARAADPADFSWVKRWSAVGDSYTAGIGSGRQPGEFFHKRDDWYCSRYDLSYPYLVNGTLGASVDDLKFPACSADRSQQIFGQINEMNGNLDLVLMTAGGNDLCLVCIIPSFGNLQPVFANVFVFRPPYLRHAFSCLLTASQIAKKYHRHDQQKH